MYPLGDVVLWPAIPIAVLLLACAAAAHGLAHRQTHAQEDPVARAYLNAKARAATSMPPAMSVLVHRRACPQV